MDLGPSSLAGVSVGLKLVTQHMLLPIKLTHVIHTALEERSRINDGYALPAEQKQQCVKLILSQTTLRTISGTLEMCK